MIICNENGDIAVFSLIPDFNIILANKKCRIYSGIIKLDEEHIVTCTQEGLIEVMNEDLKVLSKLQIEGFKDN